jgi:hypothetical protein
VSSVADGTGVVAVKLRSAFVALLAALTISGGLSWVAPPAAAGAPPRGAAHPHPHAPRKPHALTARLAIDEHADPRHVQQPLTAGAAVTVAVDLAWRLPAEADLAGNFAVGVARPSSRAPPVLL